MATRLPLLDIAGLYRQQYSLTSLTQRARYQR